MSLSTLVRPLERWSALDGLGDALASLVSKAVPPGPVKSALSGTWLGHPVHPALTDLPVGLLTAATVADLFGGEDGATAADALTVAGLLCVPATAASGLSDWADTVDVDRRLGLFHALANTGASLLYMAALVSRRGGARGTARLLSAAGLGVLSGSAYIGGHLVYGRGWGVDHNAFQQPPADWTRVARDSDLGADTPQVVEAEGYAVVLYRRGDRILAIADTCSHAGGPLHEGEVDADLCVTCPWHASRFRLEDGAVVRGPATAPQAAFDARVRDGNVEVRLRRS